MPSTPLPGNSPFPEEDPDRLEPRPAARLLVVDGAARLLLFRFEHRSGSLAGVCFWATAGGALEPGETFEAAARRELREETGMLIDDPGPQVARRKAVFTLPSGKRIEADERYFVIRADDPRISSAGWTEEERQFMTEHRWWSKGEVAASCEQIWPETLTDIMRGAGLW